MMLEQDAIDLIAMSLPKELPGDAKALAKKELQKAITALSRQNGNSFSELMIEFTLTANKSKYQFGVDIVKEVPSPISIGDVNIVRAGGGQIKIVDEDEFLAYQTQASSQSGVPVIGMFTNTKTAKTLEMWPIPDQAYSVRAKVRKTIDNFMDIPEGQRDVVVDYARASIFASQNMGAAIQFAKAGLDDMNKHPLNAWDGTLIPLGNDGFSDIRNINSGSRRVDSRNLNGR